MTNKTLTTAEVKERKEKLELHKRLEKENEQLKEQISKLEAQKTNVEDSSTKISESIKGDSNDTIKQLQTQIDLLSKMIGQGGNNRPEPTNKIIFEQLLPEDVLPQEEEVTFVARKVMYLVASFVDDKGVEHYPPYRLVFFEYAASDIAKDGNEYNVKNYCQFNTRRVKEINFLRKHPLYGITFFDNMNHMMGDDVMSTEFRVQAANTVRSLPPEMIMDRAKEFKVFDPTKSVEEMRAAVISRLADSYRTNHDEQNKERLKRNILRAKS